MIKLLLFILYVLTNHVFKSIITDGFNLEYVDGEKDGRFNIKVTDENIKVVNIVAESSYNVVFNSKAIIDKDANATHPNDSDFKGDQLIVLTPEGSITFSCVKYNTMLLEEAANAQKKSETGSNEAVSLSDHTESRSGEGGNESKTLTKKLTIATNDKATQTIDEDFSGESVSRHEALFAANKFGNEIDSKSSNK
ncbi:hypothetical protein BDAP_000663 [Binucleata daphniae]